MLLIKDNTYVRHTAFDLASSFETNSRKQVESQNVVNIVIASHKCQKTYKIVYPFALFFCEYKLIFI